MIEVVEPSDEDVLEMGGGGVVVVKGELDVLGVSEDDDGGGVETASEVERDVGSGVVDCGVVVVVVLDMGDDVGSAGVVVERVEEGSDGGRVEDDGTF